MSGPLRRWPGGRRRRSSRGDPRVQQLTLESELCIDDHVDDVIPPTVPHQSDAVVAACQSDAKALEVALAAYNVANGAHPTPPSAWSAATYAGNFRPLIDAPAPGPYMANPLTTTNYVIEYDSSGHVWVAPPGAYGAVYNAGQDFDTNPNVCLAAAR